VFEYPSPETARSDAARVAPDGYSIGPGGTLPAAQIEWVAPPHFFRRGRIIAVYLGSDQKVLDWLQGVFGEQFAGR
jgi:hypothetical protein